MMIKNNKFNYNLKIKHLNLHKNVILEKYYKIMKRKYQVYILNFNNRNNLNNKIININSNKKV